MTTNQGAYPGEALAHMGDRKVLESVLDFMATALETQEHRLAFHPSELLAHLLGEHGQGQLGASPNVSAQWLHDEYEPNKGGNVRVDAQRLQVAMWHLIARGFVTPGMLPFDPQNYPRGNAIQKLFITERGRAFLAARPDGSPAGPRFLEVFRERCQNPNGGDDLDDVRSRVEDAVSCLEGHIPRAAVVMAGLAFEVTLRRALQSMLALGVAPKSKPKNAKDTLNNVRKGIEQWTKHGTGEEQHRLRVAIGVAEAVRLERNRAAHDAAATFNEIDAEDLVRGAAHHVAVFWETVI